MNKSEIINLVLGRLGRREGDAYLLAQADTELRLLQSVLEKSDMLPWFLLSDLGTFANTTSGDRQAALPANFLREWDDGKLYIYDSTADQPYTPLDKDDLDYLESLYGSDDAGQPKAYALVAGNYELFPTPDAVYELRQRYFKKADVLTGATVENVWTQHAPDRLIAGLGIILSRYAKNNEALQLFMQDAAIADRRLLVETVAREQANKPGVRGDRD